MRLHRLRAKGWSEKEITHAHKLIRRADKKKHPVYNVLEVAVYWGLLFLTAIGTFMVSLVIAPLLVLVPTSVVLFILVVLGLCLGGLFAILIPDIEWLERRHHAFNLVVLLAVALLNVWFIITKIDGMAGTHHNPWLFAIPFALALLIPYLFHLLAEARR